MIINFTSDVDGVLLDFESTWMRCAQESLGKEIPKVSKSFYLEKRFCLTKEECHRVWEDFNDQGWWFKVRPFPETPEFIRELSFLPVNFCAVTNADHRFYMDRVISLKGIIHPRNLFLLGFNNSPETRAQRLKDMETQVFLDDQPKNCNAAVRAGIPDVILLNRDYEDLEPPLEEVTVIDHILDSLEIVSRLL